MNNLCHDQYLLVANVKHLDQRLKSAVLAKVPEATFVHVERDSLGWFLVFGGENANLALGSINLRINHAEVTRSTPGRGRVTHTRFRYSVGETLPISGAADFVLDVCMAFNACSTCSRSGLPKKSMETMSWKRCRRRVIRAGCFAETGPSKVLEQVPIVCGSGIGKPLLHLREGAIVNGLHLKDGGFTALGANGRCQPFESFTILRSVGKKVT